MQEKNPSMKRFALYVSIQVQFTIARFNMRENMVLTDLTGIKINNLRYKKLNWPLISIGDLFFFEGWERITQQVLVPKIINLDQIFRFF